MTLCGKITVPTESGEQIVECNGIAGRYLVVQLAGQRRMINFREVVACEHGSPGAALAKRVEVTEAGGSTVKDLKQTGDANAAQQRAHRRKAARENRLSRMK
jgi:hypothetical protein